MNTTSNDVWKVSVFVLCVAVVFLFAIGISVEKKNNSEHQKIAEILKQLDQRLTVLECNHSWTYKKECVSNMYTLSMVPVFGYFKECDLCGKVEYVERDEYCKNIIFEKEKEIENLKFECEIN
ncbi:hypothetical protein [Neomegalonema sp.]|uniref:hypothetical protein n=1 Tax=Neomegalonema sp. TaxID=2039713 RepID=UPI00261DA831|nr:hypothetical protein [Neomegalonema sp.]MDD2869645.1 hypothetical protein [Neomegalonema sp.]